MEYQYKEPMGVLDMFIGDHARCPPSEPRWNLSYPHTILALQADPGYHIFEAIPKLVEFMQNVRDPTPKQFGEWFNNLPSSTSLRPATERTDSVGMYYGMEIQPLQKRVFFARYPFNYSHIVPKEIRTKFDEGVELLTKDHNFKVVPYIQAAI